MAKDNSINKNVVDNDDLMEFVAKYNELRQKRAEWGKKYRKANPDKVKKYSEQYRNRQKRLLALCKERGLIDTK